MQQGTLRETNISIEKAILKMIFLFQRWDMFVPWRVHANAHVKQKSPFPATLSPQSYPIYYPVPVLRICFPPFQDHPENSHCHHVNVDMFFAKNWGKSWNGATCSKKGTLYILATLLQKKNPTPAPPKN